MSVVGVVIDSVFCHFEVESATTAEQFEELRDDIGADTIILDNSDDEFETNFDMIQLIQIPFVVNGNL